jgi:hypothetical protein
MAKSILSDPDYWTDRAETCRRLAVLARSEARHKIADEFERHTQQCEEFAKDAKDSSYNGKSWSRKMARTADSIHSGKLIQNREYMDRSYTELRRNKIYN